MSYFLFKVKNKAIVPGGLDEAPSGSQCLGQSSNCNKETNCAALVVVDCSCTASLAMEVKRNESHHC